MHSEESILQRTNRKIKENQQLQSNSIFHLNGRQYIVFPKVFSPNIFLGTEWLANMMIAQLKNSQKTEYFIQIGTGCGCIIIQILLAFPHKIGIGCDINTEAVKNSCFNLQKFQLSERLQIFQSDVLQSFSELKDNSVIFWNYPFHLSDRDYEDMTCIERGVRDKSYKGLQRLLRRCQNKNVAIYLGFSKKMGNWEFLRQKVHNFKQQIKEVASMDEAGLICLVQLTKIK